jgi:hypothetical protein
MSLFVLEIAILRILWLADEALTLMANQAAMDSRMAVALRDGVSRLLCGDTFKLISQTIADCHERAHSETGYFVRSVNSFVFITYRSSGDID